MDDFYALDAIAQANLVRSGQVSPVELVNAAILRIERLNPGLNAVITPLFESGRAVAASPRLPDGPFRGVPFLLKDFLCHSAGDPYYEGMRFLHKLRWREPQDTYLATKFRQAGFVFVGKTNLPELAGPPVTEPAAFGPTRNPWSLSRSPGGSSGGSAAAVAAGMVPVAHANDGFGSIRIPAAACGLVGLKPSRGRVSTGPARSPGILGNVAEHVLTRSVRDCAAILDHIAGPMPGDMHSAPPPQRPFLQEIGVPPGRLRVGLLLFDPFLSQPLHPECRAAVEEAGAQLEALGHKVDESFPKALTGPTGLGEALGIIASSATAARLDTWQERTGRPIGPQDVEPATWMRAEQGRSYTAVQVHTALQRITAGVCRAPEWWEQGHDLLVTPTLQSLPPQTGLPAKAYATTFGLFTMPWSITGQPAISLPLHWSGEGLPVGVQLVAGYGQEDKLFRVSAQLEQARPWAGRWPDLASILLAQ